MDSTEWSPHGQMAIHSFSSIYRWTRLSRARSLSCHPSWGFSQCQQGLQASEDLTGLVPPRELPYICCCSVAQLCPTLCDAMDCSMPGFPVLHQLLELAQTHVRRVSDAIQPSHPLSSPSPPAFNFFPASGCFLMNYLFPWGGQRIGASASTSILPMNIQDWFTLVLTWFDLLAVQGTLKSLLQHYSWTASILW